MEDAIATGGSLPTARAVRTRWSLDRDGFDALLAALHPNRNEAAERYAAMRERLSRFFVWNHANDPDALADEVLDRLTRRLSTCGSEDEAVRQPEKFAAGIARMLLRERWREQKANEDMVSALQIQNGRLHQEQEEQRRNEQLAGLLEECLQKLPPAHHRLIERYYSAEARNVMETRKKLAAEFNISLNALRNRALRIRGEVERCAREMLDRNPL